MMEKGGRGLKGMKRAVQTGDQDSHRLQKTDTRWRKRKGEGTLCPFTSRGSRAGTLEELKALP